MRPNIICSLLSFGGGIVLAIFASKIRDHEGYFWAAAGVCFVAALGILVTPLALTWVSRIKLSRSCAGVEPYLSDVDSELSTAIRNMATYSAWAKWYAAQFLANNNHQPARQHDIMNTASYLILDALMNGQILARGRPSGTIEYEDISREAWRLAAIRMEPHPNTLWRAVLFPRSDVDPERIKKLLDYDSVIVNSREFEKLWPRVDKFTDNARTKLLKKARKVGADPEHVEKLSKGHMATWP